MTPEQFKLAAELHDLLDITEADRRAYPIVTRDIHWLEVLTRYVLALDTGETVIRQAVDARMKQVFEAADAQ